MWKAHLLMMLVQVGFAGGQIVVKYALNQGANQFVFCTMRALIALAVLAPTGFFVDRKSRPAMTVSILCRLITLGFTGVFGSTLFFVIGLKLTSPVYGAASQPLIALFTFLVSLAIKTETLHLKRLDGKVKLAGIFICMAGAALVSVYKGPSIAINLKSNSGTSFRLGLLCFCINTFCMGCYIAFQAPLLKVYPASISVTAWSQLFGLFLLALVAALVSPITDWIPTPIQLAAALYMGIIGSAVNYGLITWCTTSLGPTLVGLYMPGQFVVAPLLAYILLGAHLYLGSLIGGVVIVVGFYSVLWGRQKSQELAEEQEPLMITVSE